MDYKDVDYTGMSLEDKIELKRLRSKHEHYEIFEDDWRFFADSYEGGRDALEGNIFKHQRENEEDYQDRLKRAHYLNYCSVTVDFYTNFIFSDVIERQGNTNNVFYQEFIKDVNKRGDNIDAFMTSLSNNGRIYGQMYVMVDSTVLPEVDVLTKQQEEDLGVRPYWISICPLEIFDWITDEFGKYLYIKRCYTKETISPIGTKQVYEIYQEWEQDIVYESIVDITNIHKPIVLVSRAPKVNYLGEIPIVVIRYRTSKKYKDMGNSFLKDIAPNNRSILNTTSLIDEFLYRQCFNILAKERESLLPLASQDEGDISTSNLMEYPKGANVPTYISPPVAPGQYLQSERTTITNEIFRQAVQDVKSDLSNGEQSSGFSQAQTFSRTVPFISTWAQKLENTEYKLMRLTMKYVNKAWDGKIKYKDHYEITNVTDAITNLLMLFKDLALPSKTFAITELKRLVVELDGKLSPEDLVKVYKEIEAMDFEEWKQTIQQQKGSPAEQQKPKSSGTMKEVVAESKSNVGATKKLKGK